MMRLSALVLAMTLCACSPHYNWREFRSQEAPYVVLFPAKPSTHTRAVRLDQLTVQMTMTAAEVDGVVFAVGSARLAEAAQAPAALRAMRTALAHNIGAADVAAAAQPDSASTPGAPAVPSVPTTPAISSAADGAVIEARGMRSGQPALLIGRFFARDGHIYQVVVMGAERQIDRTQVDTFLASFKPA